MSCALSGSRGSRYGWWSRSSIASRRSVPSAVATAVASNAARAACAAASANGMLAGSTSRMSLVRLSALVMNTTGIHEAGTRKRRTVTGAWGLVTAMVIPPKELRAQLQAEGCGEAVEPAPQVGGAGGDLHAGEQGWARHAGRV